MRLTEHMIIARSKESDLSTIKRINLWGCDLTDISIVKKMTNVEILALSVNNLSCLQPLESCTKLQELYLRKNNIQDFQQLLHLRNLPSLTHLWLAENPCVSHAGPNYRALVLKMLPNLKKLDDELFTADEVEKSKKLSCSDIETTEMKTMTTKEQHKIENASEPVYEQISTTKYATTQINEGQNTVTLMLNKNNSYDNVIVQQQSANETSKFEDIEPSVLELSLEISQQPSSLYIQEIPSQQQLKTRYSLPLTATARSDSNTMVSFESQQLNQSNRSLSYNQLATQNFPMHLQQAQHNDLLDFEQNSTNLIEQRSMSNSSPQSYQNQEISQQLNSPVHQHSTGQKSSLQHTTIQHSPVQHPPVQNSSVQLLPLQHSSMQHSPVQHSPVQHSPVQHSPVQHSPVQHSPVQHSPVQHSPIQHSPIQHSPVQHSSVQLTSVLHSPVQQSSVRSPIRAPPNMWQQQDTMQHISPLINQQTPVMPKKSRCPVVSNLDLTQATEMDLALKIPRSYSMQTINEQPEWENQRRLNHNHEVRSTQPSRQRFVNTDISYNHCRDNLNVNVHDGNDLDNWEDGSQTSRTRVIPTNANCDVNRHENSRSNRLRSFPQGYQHETFVEENAQTARSRVSQNTIQDFDAEDDLRSYRTGTTLSSRNLRRRNMNVLSALLCIVPELDLESLQVLEHNIVWRIDELSTN